jgi:ribosome maturation factor RimP
LKARGTTSNAPRGDTPRAGLRAPALPAPLRAVDPRSAVESTVAGLGYELVELERAGRGLLRVTIDRLPGGSYDEPGDAVTVGDCERVTRQLQFALEVEGVDYARLEVGSPGLDRALRREADYERFAGQEIALALRLPFQGRKHYRGRLGRAAGGGWQIVFDDGRAEQVLGFSLDEVREARLVPVLDFKGRNKAPAVPPGAAAEQEEVSR